MDQKLEELLVLAKEYQMTPKEAEEQRISFAYGNTAFENQAITKEMVKKLANEYKNINNS